MKDKCYMCNTSARNIFVNYRAFCSIEHAKEWVNNLKDLIKGSDVDESR